MPPSGGGFGGQLAALVAACGYLVVRPAARTRARNLRGEPHSAAHGGKVLVSLNAAAARGAAAPPPMASKDGGSNTLEQLKAMTVIVADTGDLEKIKAFHPQDATTNPTLLLQAISAPGGEALIDNAVAAARASAYSKSNENALVSDVCDRMAVAVGCEILKIVPGVVSTEVDADLSFSTERSVAKAKRLVELYLEAGVDPRERVLIKLASTWECIDACRQLEAEGIHCNMTLLFSQVQAVACAEAGATLISPFVGRILDWYKKAEGREFSAQEDPGVLSVRAIYAYYKKFGYKTIVMGASFRTADECLALAGCDKLTISPQILGELASRSEPVLLQLDASKALSDTSVQRLADRDLTESQFRLLLNENPMATEKLSEGIRSFGKDLVKLKDLVRARLNR